jgi:hypothetical protein
MVSKALGSASAGRVAGGEQVWHLVKVGWQDRAWELWGHRFVGCPELADAAMELGKTS